MPPGNVNEMAAQFTAAYQALKEKKDTERLLGIIKSMIMSAKADGISDKELIDIINGLGLREKFYPAKLKETRARLGHPETEAAVGEEPSNARSDVPALGPMAAALRDQTEGATP